jgi:hypothetical protein
MINHLEHERFQPTSVIYVFVLMNRTKTAASTTEGAKKPPTADQQTSGEITAVKLPKTLAVSQRAHWRW